ncbi:MAG: glycogen/starch/alpha-glucan phosphorylase [Clostridia bacterium]|nr:glycogen/starch/alpha-glucan phosphorylase [Clostridia bacterium]
MTEAQLRDKIKAKLLARGISDPASATAEQMYQATVHAMKDLMTKNRTAFKKRIKAQESKKVCYLCMEFLLGRSLRNYACNLGIYDTLCKVLEGFGSSFEEVYACEIDPGLGNGGLGRLAACFMDSLSNLNYAANGYSLCYENGLFKQKLIDGEQVELPDEWIDKGGAWLYARPEKSVTVRFGGEINEVWEDGALKIIHTNYDEVRAVPYDVMIPGADTDATNTLRLWRARENRTAPVGYATQGTYLKAMEERGNAEEITRQLYPPDHHDSGKLLRLTQQYFLVSASLQSIIRDYFAENGSLENFENRIAIHINDTHPTLAIPELMRILMDTYSYNWDQAWNVITKCITYTNHTVMPEALECWRVDLFKMKLPRLFSIVTEINRRFCADLWNLYPGDWDRISRMAVIGYGQVRMANLCVVASHTVNGVSALHSEILKNTIFHDYYKMTPWKFTNVTNGVVHRRWLCSANPGLSALLTECIGGEFRQSPALLANFEGYANDEEVLARLAQVKKENKARFAEWAHKKCGAVIDPNSFFDVQIKRLHEYKRQLLNVLKIMCIYNELLSNPNAEFHPQTFIFGAKAAPGYVMAKKIIRLICFLAKELESNPRTKDKIKIVFMEDYNVSMAEVLIPAADLSEQISLAGKEASGTSNMKLMMNGALTLGTMDGANVEICNSVGDDNIYIFGLNSWEVEELWRQGYEAREYYHNSDRIRAVIDRFSRPIGGEDFSAIADYLVNGGYTVADPYMCLADFDAYYNEYQRALTDYTESPVDWSRKALVNIASSGRFSSDISIANYANNIWRTSPVRKG